MSPFLKFIFLAWVLLSFSCAVGPNYQRPDVTGPSSLEVPAEQGGKTKAGKPKKISKEEDIERDAQGAKKEKKKTADKLANLSWWKVFGDPELERLVGEALQSGIDIRVAKARIEAARARANGAAWAIAPTVGAQVGAGVGKGFPQVPTPFPPTEFTGNYLAHVTVAWEIDLWGRLRRISEQASALTTQNEAALRGIYVTLSADVAQTYFEMRLLDMQRDAANEAVKVRQATRDFFHTRMEGGVSNELEVNRAEALAEDAKAQVAALEQQIVETENRISFLLARPPQPLLGDSKQDFADKPPVVPPGLPSDLLERRPDVQESEAALKAATASVGAKFAEFFPTLDLTGSLGGVSDDLSKLGNSANGSEIYRGTAMFTWIAPFLGGTRIASEHEAASAESEAAKARFEQTTLLAFREVRDALVGIKRLGEARQARERQVKALQAAEKTAQERYVGGVSSFLDVLTTQEQLLDAQLALAQVRGGQMIAVVQLFRALGGGWEAAKNQVDQ